MYGGRGGSSISALLESDTTTLEDLLDQEDVAQDIRMSSSESLKKL
jgi:hypothetical protein